jgi:hypothetical protein
LQAILDKRTDRQDALIYTNDDYDHIAATILQQQAYNDFIDLSLCMSTLEASKQFVKQLDPNLLLDRKDPTYTS